MHKKDLQTTFSTRQFMYSEDFEVYYYSDLPLKAVSPHTHNYYEFYFFLEGNVDIHVEDKTYHIKNGDFPTCDPLPGIFGSYNTIPPFHSVDQYRLL